MYFTFTHFFAVAFIIPSFVIVGSTNKVAANGRLNIKRQGGGEIGEETGVIVDIYTHGGLTVGLLLLVEYGGCVFV